MTKMTKEQKEMVDLVNNIDTWAQQEKNLYLDKQLQSLYSGDEGWEGVFKTNLPQFYRAYALALQYREEAGI